MMIAGPSAFFALAALMLPASGAQVTVGAAFSSQLDDVAGNRLWTPVEDIHSTSRDRMPGDDKGLATGLKQHIMACWLVRPGAPESRAIVELAFSLDQDGRMSGAPELVSGTGTPEDIDAAFLAACRALVQCLRNGYDGKLPVDTHQRSIKLTFDPGKQVTR